MWYFFHIFVSKKNTIYNMNNNYKLIAEQYISEIDCPVMYFEHIKSGAKVLKVNAKDNNKTFAICFKTQPIDDSGIPHILEHSVLNGSKKYPVKSPFDELLKGSMATFINAMTGGDVTMYPIASMNEKDYFNLMDIYLDAVFNPLIYKDKRIFLQEGIRLELMDKESPLEYNGVVYNEMKGYFSDPSRILDLEVNRQLFPDNGYGKCSGGDPKAIIGLTWEKFLDFHRKNYHPENSYIFLYGDADVEKELELLDKNYLQNYDRINQNFDIPLQKAFTQPKKVTSYYNAGEDNNPKENSFLSLSYAIGKNTDWILVPILNLICDYAVNQETSKIKTAFLESGIGDDIECYSDNIQQNVLCFNGINCDSSRIDEFKELIISNLKEIVKEGIDKEYIKAWLNRQEFILREGNDNQKGLKILYDIMNFWMFENNPIKGIGWIEQLEIIKQKLENNYVEEVINDLIINNMHHVLIALEPKENMDEELDMQLAEELATKKSLMSEKEIEDLIVQTHQLIEYQEHIQTPEELECIPKLALEDVKPDIEDYKSTIHKIDNTSIYCYNDLTNDIIYCSLLFNLNILDEETLMYLPIWGDILLKVDTENYTLDKLDTEIKISTGGLGGSTKVFTDYKSKNRDAISYASIAGKFLSQNVDKFFNLLYEILFCSKIDNKEKIREIINRSIVQSENTLNSGAFSCLKNRSEAYWDMADLVDDKLTGLDAYIFEKNIFKDFDNQYPKLIEKLKYITATLFSKENFIVQVTLEEKNNQLILEKIKEFKERLPISQEKLKTWNFKPERLNEGFYGPSKVQYVMQSFNFLDYGHQDNAKLTVLNKIISNEYLHTEVRVKGGAYGGFSSVSCDGMLSFYSYRDPNLKNTVNVFKDVAKFISNWNTSEEDLLKYIISSLKETPVTISQKGSTSFSRMISGRGYQEIMADRKLILQTSVKDIKDFGKILEDFSRNASILVYGNKEKIEESKELFKTITNIIS